MATVTADITAQNQWTSWEYLTHTGFQPIQVAVKGDWSNGSTVTIQAWYFLIDSTSSGNEILVGEISASDGSQLWVGELKGPVRVRAGVATGDFGAGDNFTIILNTE